MNKTEKFPSWVLKLLPVLTEHISITDFEKWMYLPTSEKFFPKELYLELISVDYKKGLSELLNYLSGCMQFEQRCSLYIIVEFLKNPDYLDYIDFDKFKLLPISDILLEYLWVKINEINKYVYWDELTDDFMHLKETRELLDKYLRNVVLLLSDYENRTIIGIMRELHRIYK